MRKTWKRALSFVLSAALVLTAGGFGSVQNSKTAKAADAWFTATMESYGAIWGWTATPTTPDAWEVISVNVDKLGDYTVKGIATQDASSDGGAFIVNTNLEALPAGYTIVGKSVKIGSKTLDWSKAQAYMDGGKLRISMWNEWGDEKANPLGDVAISKGDKVEATFSVVESKTLNFKATLNSFGAIWGWNTTPVTPDAWDVISADVTKAGDYTVKAVAQQDASSSTGAFVVNTNLNFIPTGYSITGKTVKIGSKTLDWSKAQAYADGGIIRISMWNEWGDEKANPLGDVEIAKGDKVEATFTVKSTAGNKPPVTPPVKKVIGVKKGKTFTAGNFKYKVTTAATIQGTKKTAGKVTVVGLSKSGKKKSSISVKNTVKKSSASYKVTAVGSKAFKKAAKLKKATLGTNIKSIPTSAFDSCKKLTTVSAKGVTKIGKSAFKNCKKLSKLTLGKKKLSSVKKGAFKGCKKKIKVSGGSKKVKKANIKKLKKSGYKKFK